MKSIDLVRLAQIYAADRGLTLKTVATYAQNDGKFFDRLADNGTCTLKVANRVLAWFDANWPGELQWPNDIGRPSSQKRRAA